MNDTLRVGLNKILVEEVSGKYTGTIELPEHLRNVRYKIIKIGIPRTSLDRIPDINEGDVIQTLPNSGFDTKIDDQKYKVISFDDVLLAF